MGFNSKKNKIFQWVIKGLSVVIILIGLPFYFGYGNPLPFISAAYTVWDNVWLSVFPLMFLGLFLGLKYEKLGGYLVVFSVGFGLLFGFFYQGEIVYHMLVPFFVGFFNLLISQKK